MDVEALEVPFCGDRLASLEQRATEHLSVERDESLPGSLLSKAESLRMEQSNFFMKKAFMSPSK